MTGFGVNHIRKIYLLIAIISVFLAGSKPIDPFPQVEIKNGLIHARLYLPDHKNGYYRGSRFDWSGVIPELGYKGHTYFGQWFENYSPLIHDAIMGPVDAFNPVGYAEAKAGDLFLKIGIGMVTKPEESKYSFVTPYPIANGGKWKVKKRSDRVEFTHTLKDKNYAYTYKKLVQLKKDKPEMALICQLKNTGKQTIETQVYNHNFFQIDNQTIGPDYKVTFPFKLTSEVEGKPELGKIRNNQILFQKELAKSEHLFFQSLQGFGTSSKDYDIKIENKKTGAAVRITGDQPLAKLVFWSAQKTICPEPYINIKVKPGETFRWTINYQFYIAEKTNPD